MSFALPMDTLPLGRRLASIPVPGSKSVTNRCLLLAALAKGRSRLRGGLDAEDTRWFRRALGSLGISVHESENGWAIEGGQRPHPQAPLELGASGTTLRFLLPWLALNAEIPVELTGEPRLFERPLAPLLMSLEAVGVRWQKTTQGGILHPAPHPDSELRLEVDASLSSQFISGLALALAGLPKGGLLSWMGAAASSSYLELTDFWLARFQCRTTRETTTWSIPGGQLRPQDLLIPGDWSGAAAFLCAAAVTGRTITISPLDPDDPQGDRQLVSILTEAGCSVSWEGNALTLGGPLLKGLDADLSRCPDLAPVLAAVAALAPGPSRLSGLETLPLKECDRLEASAELVAWLGGSPSQPDDASLIIHPGPSLRHRPPFDPRRDHRMAFAAAVGALRYGGELKDPGCVAKTFPGFWDCWATMLARS